MHYSISWEQWRERLHMKEMEKENCTLGSLNRDGDEGREGGQLMEQSRQMPGRKASP